MKNKTVFFTHTIAVYTLFILGNAIIDLPQNNANVFSFAGYLTSIVIGFIILLPLLFFVDKISNTKNQSRNNIIKILLILLLISAALFSLWCAADVFKSFVNFAFAVMLPDMPRLFIILLFLFICIYFLFQRQENILKFCLLSFWFVLIVTVFFFILAVDRYNLRNIFIFKLPDLKTFLKQTKPYIMNPASTMILLPLYNMFVFKDRCVKASLTGTVSGFIILGICILNSILLFGADLSGQLGYPYISAISTISIGRLFTRLDEFAYLLFFITCTIKITVCGYVAFNCLKRVNTISKEKN